jgi:hypothetical protein
MKETLSTHEIAGRLSRDEHSSFSWGGGMALAEYLEELEADIGEEIEFDMVGIRCDFAEWESLQEWAHDYFSNAWEELGIDETDVDSDEFDEKIREYIQENGTLIEFDGGIIVSSF